MARWRQVQKCPPDFMETAMRLSEVLGVLEEPSPLPTAVTLPVPLWCGFLCQSPPLTPAPGGTFWMHYLCPTPCFSCFSF
jgi:hypothetical protein